MSEPRDYRKPEDGELRARLTPELPSPSLLLPAARSHPGRVAG